ncbi:ABC transporter permease [Propionibacterium australiense]|uniref:Binding-protein-dependent transport system inner membrane component n=1 Tax=Propionibacterium australiense TaxID=119981 RepID=A0A383S7U1_9ACTN|nr:ABC transporter permease [Propionibacterium australiense]RLP08736.1 ABC transporter permease subunit [Propionibacterium australiense]SYZ33316.1 Binding-protein-dependent transport system inner membrane component [Propionibacterium australiense]VEH89781.1 Putative osmoprotectant uptake system permease protein yehY [Propionibacterium australiense]
MGAFIASRWADIAFRMYQHASLVVQSVLLAAVIAIVLAVVVTSVPRLEPVANAISTIGLTIPSFALLGLFIPLFGIGTVTSVAVVTFYATLPILRNAVVGLLGVDSALIESARGMGMKPLAVFLRVQLPLAWPVILTGLRVSTQMSMGVAAIAAYVLGPGLGSYIFTGLTQIGGRNALNYALVGTVGVVVVALIADAVLALLGRVTISKGIRA